MTARYRLQCTPETIAARARALAIEQSIEMPLDAVRDERVRAEIAGEVVAIAASGPGQGLFDVDIALAVESAGNEPGQLMNVLFGNCSLQPDVELVDLQLPEPMPMQLPGPRFGIDGWRSAVGCAGDRRALSCSALKPQGLPAQALAELAYTFARAGIDVVKDDHGIADQEAAPFAQRVPLVQRAIARANRDKERSGTSLAGHRSVYAPTLSGGPARLAAQMRILRDEGVGAALVCPMVIGIPSFVELVRADAGVPLLAHPALGGSARIAPALLLGKLFRLFGADATIFPNQGGRFSLPRSECLAIAHAARAPRAACRPALPVPAGGMHVGRVREMLDEYGSDTMLLIGGDLLAAGNEMPQRAALFASRVAHHGHADG